MNRIIVEQKPVIKAKLIIPLAILAGIFIYGAYKINDLKEQLAVENLSSVYVDK